MKRVLGAGDLIMFGIGGIVGAGVFVLTGVGAHDAAGPAIIVSYLIASLAAGLSALCYTEFAVDMPIAGGAFNYVAIECGEVFGWISGWNLVLEYTLSVAAVGRGFRSIRRWQDVQAHGSIPHGVPRNLPHQRRSTRLTTLHP